MNRFLSLVAAGLTAASMSYAGPGLADGAAKFVGNITQSNTAPGPNDEFTKLWNQATAENGCKWGSIEGTRGTYSWAGCDAAYNWARDNGGHFKFHALLWGSQYPSWLESLSVDETKKAITAWFDAVAKRYPDAEMIDVANEAIRTYGGGYHSNYKKTKIIEAMGGDNNGDYAFLTTAFKMARERWPKAILIYNDYNTIQHDTDRGIELINTIKKNGAPVDAYGLQAHDLMTTGGGYNGTGGGGNCMDYNQFTSTMKKIHQQTNNIPIFISEYDAPSTDDKIQEQCYKEHIKYWMEDPIVAGITIWGYIYGRTWLDCNGQASGCSGIIRNGQDRPAMTWLKDYLSKNKGVNETGLIGEPVEPEPQTPYGGKAAVIPGKIEAENFDVPGKGRNEDGTTNQSYSVASSGHGNVDLRSGDSPNLYKGSTGVVIGYNNNDNWYEYTVEIAETGTYTMFAAVASGSGGAFSLSMDGKAITESIAVPAAKSGDTDSFSEFEKVSAKVNLTAGKHIMRLTVDKEYFDIDYITFVAGENAEDPEPIGEENVNPGERGEETPAIAQNLHMNMDVLQAYDIFDMQGMFLGRLRAYSIDQAIWTAQNSDVKYAKGVYTIRNNNTKQMRAFTIAR